MYIFVHHRHMICIYIYTHSFIYSCIMIYHDISIVITTSNTNPSDFMIFESQGRQRCRRHWRRRVDLQRCWLLVAASRVCFYRKHQERFNWFHSWFHWANQWFQMNGFNASSFFYLRVISKKMDFLQIVP